LVLLASRLGPIELIPKTHEGNPVTVRKVISHLPAISHGGADPKDRYHRASELSPLNLRRIKSTPKDGGNSRDWDATLKLKCHVKKTGKTYVGTVYGRMRWDDTGSTMTTQCIGIGNGRFGHPEQNRAISLREAALLQTFPKNYRFIEPKARLYMGQIAKFIGNAVPVRLGRIIGRSIKRHVGEYGRQSSVQV
jgi:DNA (cytosine-5)-methyltransferase 1